MSHTRSNTHNLGVCLDISDRYYPRAFFPPKVVERPVFSPSAIPLAPTVPVPALNSLYSRSVPTSLPFRTQAFPFSTASSLATPISNCHGGFPLQSKTSLEWKVAKKKYGTLAYPTSGGIRYYDGISIFKWRGLPRELAPTATAISVAVLAALLLSYRVSHQSKVTTLTSSDNQSPLKSVDEVPRLFSSHKNLISQALHDPSWNGWDEAMSFGSHQYHHSPTLHNPTAGSPRTGPVLVTEPPLSDSLPSAPLLFPSSPSLTSEGDQRDHVSGLFASFVALALSKLRDLGAMKAGDTWDASDNAMILVHPTRTSVVAETREPEIHVGEHRWNEWEEAMSFVKRSR